MGPADHPPENIGARVRAARSYANLSQQTLAERIGLERKVVLAIENNEARHELTVPEARRIAETTSVPINFLLHGWMAGPELYDRVAALESDLARYVSQWRAERDGQKARVDALERVVQTRLAELASEESSRATRQPGGQDHPKEGPGQAQ